MTETANYALTSADVERLVKDVLLKSALGEIVQKSVQSALDTTRYDSPVKKAIDAYVSEVVALVVREKFTTQIRELVVRMVESTVTADMLTKITKQATDQLTSKAAAW